MSKRKKIQKLEKQVADLEAKLAAQEAPAEAPKKNAKTAVNVYFDSNFVNSLAQASDDRVHRAGRLSREERRERRKSRRPKTKFGRFMRFIWKLFVVLLVIALILLFISIVTMAIVWALVNFGVMTADANPFIAFVWQMLTWTFGLFGMPVPAT